ncbi:phosphoribosylformylglycinamidine synthase subunit PurS [Oceanotoga sp. DSM 15011]|jgi:phosphoribosylformylglycinamidine synthase PurS subunit|uniref:Phosphoribosylformylglycinamidine synthase subunit PurS n=1 Tax=Oceanotoga teriensis TaxID=515440 RepID=A0AA45C8M5_9BACT|nr:MULTISPECIES: phosphoribosylformylglycinamidine synthase subunit PurS [Oceanotoga]MDN5342081.1 phosphoribosylformylglycinamidine synthase subunit PurS [Oceanotoga sp.]MDO7975449.1 phosphoribosylformylglycinamidine synthase subunit PurS [Oceanotoga teriensis]PWJ96263.1 phosphoribosylformylglycinamidine synthase PurS subunit [Oceanotoga teriensis]UYP00047.1 phosphoribosylformylglycinamidine synthase subunit PurS [Oceanotoga sp. DSM 15011]
MKKFEFQIQINLKDGILDTQAIATDKVLKRKKIYLENISFGKIINISLEEENFEIAYKKIEDISHNLLSNPVLENFKIIPINSEVKQ